MDYSFGLVNSLDVEVFDSEVDSDVQLVFLPGGMNPEIWKHQLRYFGNDYRTISFRNPDQTIDSEYDILKKIFDEFELENVVLFSAWEGNLTSTGFCEYEEKILGRILVGDERSLTTNGKNFLNIFDHLKHPKIVKKTFFTEKYSYRRVKDFKQYLSFSHLENYCQKGDKLGDNFLRVRGESDKFSRGLNDCKSIGGSGSFPFFERPEEFNEVSVNYLKYLGDIVREYQVAKVERKNGSLEDFSEKRRHDKSLKHVTKG